MTEYRFGGVIRKVSDPQQQQNNNSFINDISYLVGQEVEITDTGVAANTTFSVAHSLNRIPDHVELLVWKDGTTSAYTAIRPSGVAWTRTTLSLQCNTANAAIKIRVR